MSIVCRLLCALVGMAFPVLLWAGVAVAGPPLDPAHPVVVLGDHFTYDGKDCQLDNHHYLVDATLDSVAAASCPYLFTTFQEAAARLNDGTPEQPMVVYVAPGVYWIDDPDDPEVRVGKGGREPFGMTVQCQYLHLVGLSHDPRNVVLAAQRGQTQGAVGNFTMFDFHGDGLEVSQLTMGNFCNVDLDFPLKPTLGRKKRHSAITQAHVAYCHGDKVVARNVRFISRLNLNPLNGARRILFDNCHFECTDDALTGNGVYLHCDFDFYGQKPFYTTSGTGAVMLDCDFHVKSDNTRVYFCKASGPLTLIDCRFHSPQPVYVGWTAYPAPWLRCYYSHVTLNGSPIVVESEHPETSVCLDGKPLLQTYKNNAGYNINGLLAGDDGWCPAPQTLPAATPGPTSLRLSPAEMEMRGGERPQLIGMQLRRHGGYLLSDLPPKMEWQVQQGFEKYLKLEHEGETVSLSSDYDEDTPMDITVTATTTDGLVGAMLVHLSGKPLPAPTLARPPRIKVKDGTAMLDYRLVPAGHADQSVVTWYAAGSPSPEKAIVIAESHGEPLTALPLTQGDVGQWLMAAVEPRHARSGTGERQWAVMARPVGKKQVRPATVLETDFSSFPCQWQPEVREGRWTVDGYKPADTEAYPWTFDRSKPMWEYGEGYNGAVGSGLLQAQRGARMMFTPVVQDEGMMTVALDVDPTKTAGQGFGSATGQYMDVCLKFDTRTLTGYGLRIVRTTKYAKAVDFLLVAYDHGQVKPLTAPISATCYRTGCHIRLAYKEGRLTAYVSTDTPLPPPDDPNLHTEVQLSASVSASPYSGFCLQHTGSCGESTTMLHHLRLEWPSIQLE